MKTVTITARPGFDEWREQARACLKEGLPPDRILWGEDENEARSLFADSMPAASRAPSPPTQDFAVPRAFIDRAAVAACHRAPERFDVLYRILWRLRHENANLLCLTTDSDVMKLQSFVRAVRRDAYKIKAFLRFRGIMRGGEEHFVAWYEPEHYSLDLSLPFFQTRFKNMTWSILTPYRAAHWDRHALALDDRDRAGFYPESDDIEKYWLTYYGATFNPARPKKQAMLNQMPKKYWKNMPETVLIRDLLRGADARARRMIADGGAQED